MKLLLLALLALSAPAQTIVRTNGQGMWFPADFERNLNTPSFTDLTASTANARFANCGYVWTPSGGTKSIRKVQFRFGSAITKAGGTDIEVSLQDISTAAQPIRPDGTADQTYTVLDSDGSYAANTWYTTGNLSADRSIAYGAPLCVVWTPSSYGGSDAFRVSVLSRAANDAMDTHIPASVISADAGSTWSEQAQGIPNVIFEFSDGTFGSFIGGHGWSAVASAVSYNTGTAGADEYALKITLPYGAETDGMMAEVRVAATNVTYDVILYQGTTAVDTVTVSPFWTSSTAAHRYIFVPWSQRRTLTANTAYYVAIKPTSTNNLILQYNSVSAAGLMDALYGGSNAILSKRLDAGSWSDETTQRPFIALSISGIASGSSSGGAFGYVK